MNFLNKFTPTQNISLRLIFFIFFIGLIILCFISFPLRSSSIELSEGENLFVAHCAGCHIKGGNIIRRNKTLKSKDLSRNGIDTPNAIAKIAKEGIGSMSGYKDVLGEKGDQIVANWIWEQSQNAWIQG